MSAALTCRNVSMTYGSGELSESVLEGVTSGSGKTTLLSIIGCLLTPSGGDLTLAGVRVPFGEPERLGTLRREKLGFVFQHAQLLPFLNAEQNVALVGENSGLTHAAAQARAAELLAHLGMEAARTKLPGQLSGGQRQRVAIARALVHRPPIVLADEPTAALDWHHGQTVAQLLVEQTRAAGAALVVVTHDRRLVPRFDRVFAMDQGRLCEEGRG